VGEVCLFLPDFGRKLCVKLIITYKMKEQMKRTVYEAPETKLFRIEMESGFCSGSADVENPDDAEQGRIDDHDINTNFGVDGDGGSVIGGSWSWE